MRNPVDRLAARLPTPWRVAVDWIVTVGVAIGLVLALKAWVVNPYRIPSSSMEPTLHCSSEPGCEGGRFSDRVLANRLVYRVQEPERGDIVVFQPPPRVDVECPGGGSSVFVKRLVALPGETWRMEDGVVYVDGKRLVEPYLQPERRGHDIVQPQKVPPGHYVMLGDNRQSSCDSRAWGTVPRDNFIGKVITTYWPPQRLSLH
jgi:signal peptidase I